MNGLRLERAELLLNGQPNAAAPGRPVVIYDCTGAAGVLGSIIKAAPIGSRIVVAGIAPGEEAISPLLAISKELTLQFVAYYTLEEFAQTLGFIADGALGDRQGGSRWGR